MAGMPSPGPLSSRIILLTLEDSGCSGAAASGLPSSGLPQGPGPRPHQSLPPTLSSLSSSAPALVSPSSDELPRGERQSWFFILTLGYIWLRESADYNGSIWTQMWI